jgi:1-phosphofructokinase
MLLTVTLNPCIDHAIFVDQLLVGDTNRVARVERDAGGKGLNVSRVFAELGGSTTATGFLGGQSAGFIHQVLSEQRVGDGFVSIAGETRVNVSVEDLSGNPPTTLNEKGPLISDAEMNSLLDYCHQVKGEVSWVSLGGSIPPGLGKDAFLTIGKVFAEARVPVMLDADGEPLTHGLKLQPQFVKPNASEAARLLGMPVDTDEEALTASRTLYEMIGGGQRFAVISRGKDGAVVTCHEGTFIGRSPGIEPKSTIGSGDSFIAGMLWGITSGLVIEESLRLGLAAGAATAVTDGREIGRRKVIELLVSSSKVTKQS